MKSFKQFLFETPYTKNEEETPQDFDTEVESQSDEKDRQKTYQQEIEKAKNKKLQPTQEQQPQRQMG